MMKGFQTYFFSCGLRMNPSKSELVVFSRGHQQQPLNVGGQEENTHAKLLGVTVQKGYQFQKHVQLVLGTVRTKLEKLSKVVPMMDTAYYLSHTVLHYGAMPLLSRGNVRQQ